MLFTTPIGGTAYEDWTIVNYVDRDPSGGLVDYRGGNFTYNGHRGTDYTLPNFAAMDRGIPVYAAADGTVIATRDGEFDRCTPENPCGDRPNLVTIDHGDGLITRYLHLRKDSVAVSVGDTVVAGEPIAQVGSSGLSSDAHLHFEVSLDGQIIDPYEDVSRWWKSPTAYAGDVVGVLDFDIVAQAPSITELRERPVTGDMFTQMPGQTAFMWTHLHGIDQGDDLTFSFFQPDGTLFNQFSWEDVSAFSYGWWVAALGLPDNPDVGQWQVEFEHNGLVLATDSFTVASADEPLTLVGRKGKDTLVGASNNDTLKGRRGNDELFGLAGDDLLFGGKGRDALDGGLGNDILKGGLGPDQLLGDEGDDVLRGGKGRDFLDGGLGNDVLIGGGGQDTFVLAIGAGIDRIRDFRRHDRLALTGSLGMSDLAFSGNDIIFGETNEVLATLTGVNTNQLKPYQFVTA